jgi:hypothetical protein
VGENQRGRVPQTLQLLGLHAHRSLQLDIDQLAAKGSSLAQNIQLRGDRTFEFPSTGRSAACGHNCHMWVVLSKLFDFC